MIGPQVVANRPENVKDGGGWLGAGRRKRFLKTTNRHEFTRMKSLNEEGRNFRKQMDLNPFL